MKLLLDTNRYTDMANALAETMDVMEQAEAVVLPLIVLGELRGGFAMGKRRDQNERILAAFLKAPNIAVVAPDELTTRHYADLYRQTRMQGTPIPTNDLWIAALAIQHDLVLYTRDSHFQYISQLRRL